MPRRGRSARRPRGTPGKQRRPPAQPAAGGHRPFQGLQRPARPSGWRSLPAGRGRGVEGHRRPRRRQRGALWRRGVRGDRAWKRAVGRAGAGRTAARGGGGPAAAGRVGQYQHRRGLPASTGPGQCRSVAGGRRCRPVCRQAGRPQPGGAARACAG
ncbi:hypothetical protein G6F59_016815 [Rhizopus arrhizus]|nr:hypothetical protein G6F59_016815 [Rhizopus arrhizus]